MLWNKFGQRDENERRACAYFHVVREAGRNDNQARGNGHERVQQGDVDGLAHERVVFVDVGAKDGHAAHTEREGEKSLVHGGDDDLSPANGADALDVRQQVKGEAFPGAGQKHRVDGQDEHNGQQQDHHDFGDAFQPFAGRRADEKADADDAAHKKDERPGAGVHRFKVGAIASGPAPSNAPLAVSKKYLSIHPATVV